MKPHWILRAVERWAHVIGRPDLGDLIVLAVVALGGAFVAGMAAAGAFS
jgi:hypothetical protein